MLIDKAILESYLLKERGYDVTTFRVVERVDSDATHVLEKIDNFVEQLAFEELGEDWIEISQKEAQSIAETVLHRDLAYGDRVMKLQRARQLAEGFLALFNEAPRYFTNGEFGTTGEMN